MKTNFFERMAALQVEGDWQITIKAAAQHFLVSVLFTSDKVNDAARKLIPPMILKGSIAELDEGFFAAITKPVQQTHTLFVNMVQYEKAQEEAREKSKKEQQEVSSQKKEQATANKKWEAAMKKVAELEGQQKWREAYAQMPKVSDFPDKEEQITEKKQALAEKFDSPTLFK